MENKDKMTLIEEIYNLRQEGMGDTGDGEKELLRILEKDEERAGQQEQIDLLFDQEYCKFFFSATLVLVLLVSWAATTSLLIKADTKEDSPDENDYITFIHNIVFGLATAVVIQELGEEKGQTSLYYQFLETYRKQQKRSKEHSFKNENGWWCLPSYEKVKTYLTMVILWSTRLYIISWIILGFISLLYGAIARLEVSNTLYTTGQTWLGIAVTLGYSYFGLSGKNNPDSKVSEKDSPVSDENEGGEKPNDGGSQTKTTFTNKEGETKIILTRQELNKEHKRFEKFRKTALKDGNNEDVADYQKCLNQLEKLRESFPTVDKLKEKIDKARKQQREAVEDEDYDTAGKLKKEVKSLEDKLKFEEAAANANTDTQENDPIDCGSSWFTGV